MEGKTIKEEQPDKDSISSSAPYPGDGPRRGKGGQGQGQGGQGQLKDRCHSATPPPGGEGRSPAGGEGGSPSSNCAPRVSPHHNGSAGSGSPGICGSTGGGGQGSEGRPPPARLKRFLSTLVQFAADQGTDPAERVRSLVHNLVSSTISVEEFQQALQEATNFPLRPFVLPFLRAALPPLQREVQALARVAKQPPLQYVRNHESVALEPGVAEPADMFLSAPSSPGGVKRSAADALYDGCPPQTNGAHHSMDPLDYQPPPKRSHPSQNLLVNPSPLLFPLQTHSHLFEYPHPYHIGFHSQNDPLNSSNFENQLLNRRDSTRESLQVMEQRASTSSMAANMAAGLSMNSIPNSKNDEEWKNINTMLNCILSMVEKTKRALAILQQRGNAPEGCSPEGADMKRAAGEIMAATVRQTEERVGEVRRRAEESVNQVKRQAVAELQRAAAAERARLERLLRLPTARRANSQSPPVPEHHNTCWNCGRKAQETCSGCNVARYCGAFCQHKDWENHHQVCCGRDQKPPASLLSVTSPPTITNQPAQPPLKPSQITRSSTPVSSSTSERLNLTTERLTLNQDRLTESRLSLTSLNNAERLLTSANHNAERLLTSASHTERLLTSASQERLTLSNVQGERLGIPVPGNAERITLASLGGSQGLVGGVGGKK